MKHFDKLANEVLTGLTKTADSRVEFLADNFFFEFQRR